MTRERGEWPGSDAPASEAPSGSVRRASGLTPSPEGYDRDDLTQAMASPPPEDHTKPEVQVPQDVPPDDLTEMHMTYEAADEGTASLPREAPFGAHREPEPTTLPIERWTPPPAAPSAPQHTGATRVRTRTIAVEEGENLWAPPAAVAPSRDASEPATLASVPPATVSSPPSVVVSPSMAPLPPGSPPLWTPPSYPSPSYPPSPPQSSYAPAPQGYAPGPLGAYAPQPGPSSWAPPRQGAHGTVEMNLAMMKGVPTPVPFGPQGAMGPAPVSVASAAPPPTKGGVSKGVWMLVVMAIVACVAMMAWARMRGGSGGQTDGVGQGPR